MKGANQHFEKLSVRAKNVIADIGLEKLLIRYSNAGNLNSLRRVGGKTNEELSTYLDLLLAENDTVQTFFSEESNLNVSHVKKIIELYKYRLSPRAEKVITQLLKEDLPDHFTRNLLKNKEYKYFLKQANCGAKTACELVGFLEFIRELLLGNEQAYSEGKSLNTELSFENLDHVLTSSLWFEQLKKKHQYLIKEVFLRNQHLSFEAIAKELNVTRERVRQIVFNLENFHIPKFLKSIDLKKNFTKSIFNGREKELPYFILDFTKIREKQFISEKYNDRFIRIVYCCLLDVEPYYDFLKEKFSTATKTTLFPFIGEKKPLNYDQLMLHVRYISDIQKSKNKEQINNSKIELLFNSKFGGYDSELFDFKKLINFNFMK
jgi:hypothetical protein